MTNKLAIPEAAEQKALVTRCRMENIEVIGIENSLQFPISAILDILKSYLNDIELRRVKSRLQTLIATMTNKRYAQGMKKGCPDLFFPQLKLFIELKRRDGGVISDVQKECHKMLRSSGYDVKVAYGAKQAFDIIKEKLYKKNNL